MPNEISRRTMLGVSVAAAVGVLVRWTDVAGARPSPDPRGGWPQFVRPPASTAPKFRWWWPNGQVDVDEIAREVNAVADAHCGGLEVSDVHHSGLVELDVEQYGWGSPRWLDALETALSQAQRRGITIDLSIGPSWPAALPTITADSAAAPCQ